MVSLFLGKHCSLMLSLSRCNLFSLQVFPKIKDSIQVLISCLNRLIIFWEHLVLRFILNIYEPFRLSRVELCYFLVLISSLFDSEFFWNLKKHRSAFLWSKEQSPFPLFYFFVFFLDCAGLIHIFFSTIFEFDANGWLSPRLIAISLSYLGTPNKVIYLVHEFGSSKDSGKSCYTLRELTSTTDTRFLVFFCVLSGFSYCHLYCTLK